MSIFTPKMETKKMNYRKWNNEDIEFIKNNADKMDDIELASRLSELTSTQISVSMIRNQRRKIGVKKPRGRKSKNIQSLSSIVDFNN